MRFFILFNILLSWSYYALGQQDNSGVYLSTNDFENKKIAYAIDCRTQKHKIKQTSFSAQKFIKIIHNDTLHTLLKSETFGYQDCKGAVYRFIEGLNYVIVNPTEYILIYRHELRPNKGTEVSYMFSRGVESIPSSLTRANLIKAFPDQPEFQKKVDEIFRRDTELSRYDEVSKVYLVNWLYQRVNN